jgi:hypothetical protein
MPAENLNGSMLDGSRKQLWQLYLCGDGCGVVWPTAVLQRRTTAYLMLHGLEPAASGSPAVAASGSRAVSCRACWKPCRAVTAGDGGTPTVQHRGDRRVWWLLLPLLLHTVSGLMLGDCCCCCTPRPAAYFAAAGGSRQHGTAAGHGGSSNCGSWARSWALR